MEIFSFYGIMNLYSYAIMWLRYGKMGGKGIFGNGRKTIGVILCDVSSHYQEQICHTISSYAQTVGYNVAYFTFYTCYGTETRNGRGEANIIHLVPYEDLDAIIFCHDTLTNEAAREKTWQ